MRKARTSGFLVCSDAIYAELSEVLMRPKFDKYVSRESRQQFLTAYQNAVLWVDIAHAITACRDAKDNKFLEVAVSADASCIISGDDDLLVLHPYGNVQILTPVDFLAADESVAKQQSKLPLYNQLHCWVGMNISYSCSLPLFNVPPCR